MRILFYVLALLLSWNAYAQSWECPNNDKQKTILISGGASGLGREIATFFKEKNWNVWITTSKQETYNKLRAQGEKVLFVTADTPEAEVFSLMQAVRARTGRIDVLVNNAGYGIVAAEETVTREEFLELLKVNTVLPATLIRAVAPFMRRQGEGRIVSVSSTSGRRALPGLGHYASSKFALEGLMEGFAASLSPWGIFVSLVEPGTIKNAWAQNTLVSSQENFPEEYGVLQNNLKSQLVHKAELIGQEQSEIAALIWSIVQEKSPHLRYQTNPTVSALAKRLLVDPSGDEIGNEMKKYARDLMEFKED